MNLIGKLSVIPLILVLGLIFITSCKKELPWLPMDKTKITQIIEDLYIAESMADGADLTIRDSLKNDYLQQVASHHGLRLGELDSLLLALTEMPDSLHLIQGMALDSLRAKQLVIREKENLGL